MTWMSTKERVEEQEFQVKALEEAVEHLRNGFTTREGRFFPPLSSYFWHFVSEMGYTFENVQPSMGKFIKKEAAK